MKKKTTKKKTIAQRLEAARKEYERALSKWRYLEDIANFKPVTRAYCQQNRLCTKAAEDPPLYCAQPAFTAYRSRDEKQFKKNGMHYLCMRHSSGVKEESWADDVEWIHVDYEPYRKTDGSPCGPEDADPRISSGRG